MPATYRNLLDSTKREGDCPVAVSAPAANPENPRISWWLWPNVLSLDAPLVAVLWQEALSRAHHVKLLPGCDLALGLAVWLIYIVDRVLDGCGAPRSTVLSPRHAFYRRHRVWLVALVIPALGAWLLYVTLWMIPADIMWRGAALGFLVGVYLLHYSVHRSQRWLFLLGNAALCLLGLAVLLVFPLPLPVQMLYGLVLAVLIAQSLLGRQNSVPKEFVCGYLFALGCGLSVRYLSLDAYAGPFSPETLMLALLFALNCVAISCYERKTDRTFDPGAIFQIWPGVARVYPLLLLSLAVFSVLAIGQTFSRDILAFGGAIFLSTLLLGALHYFSKRMSADLARVLADAALVLPILVIFIAP